MKEFYVNSLNGKKRKHADIYNSLIKEKYGKELKWEEVQEKSVDDLRHLVVELDHRVRLTHSPIDVTKLARAIQDSRSGIGGCAMTNYTCHFCGATETWSNTAVPNICRNCATQMATKIAMYFPDVLKTEVEQSMDFDLGRFETEMNKFQADDQKKQSRETEKGLMHAGSLITLTMIKKRVTSGKYSRKKNREK